MGLSHEVTAGDSQGREPVEQPLTVVFSPVGTFRLTVYPPPTRAQCRPIFALQNILHPPAGKVGA